MKKKDYSDDDGRTIVNMNVEGFAWYESEDQKKAKREIRKKSPAEKKMIFRETYRSVAIPLICGILGVGLAFLLLYYCWL